MSRQIKNNGCSPETQMNSKSEIIEPEDSVEVIEDDDTSSVEDFIKELEAKEKDLHITADYKIEISDFDFEPARRSTPLQDNIADFVAKFRPSKWYHRRPRTRDANYNLILQKTSDAPYLLPLDVATGTPPPNEEIKRRYWPVYSQWLEH